MLVVVPPFSPYAAAASTTSAGAFDFVRNVSTAMIRGAPAIIRRARSVSGKSASGSQPSSTRHSMLPAAAALAIPDACIPSSPGTQTHLDRADDVAAAQRRQHLGCRRQLQRRDDAIADLEWMLGEVGPAGDDRRHCPWPSCVGDRRVVPARATGLGDCCRPGTRSSSRRVRLRPLRFWANSMIRLRRFCAASRSRRYSTGSSSLRSGASRMMVAALAASSMVARSKPSRLICAAVAQLRVDVRRADDVVGQPGPGVRVLVGAAGAAEHGDRAGAAGGLAPRDQLGGASQRRVPRRRLQLVADAHQRRGRGGRRC